MRLGSSLVRPSLLLCLVACSPAPKLAATGTGDVSNPPAERRAPDAELLAKCGNGAPTSSSVQRRPYLQQVTQRESRVLFTRAIDSETTVDVWRADGGETSSRLAVRNEDAAGQPFQVTLDELEPDTTYCYALRGLTAPAGFRTAPDGVNAGQTVRFAAFGDSGSGNSYQRAVFQQIQTVPYDFVVHLGDLAYEKGTSSELENRFFYEYRSLERSFAVFPVIGNHDNATSQGAPYLHAFDLPDNGVAGERERFYSIDWGPVHLVALDTERMNEAQAAWLDQDLTANDRPWVVVALHRPPYSSGEHGSNASVRKIFGPVLAKHQVPLVLSGHEHNYERTDSIDGTVYVVSGGGGKDTRDVGWSDFTAYAEDVLHFVFVEASSTTLVLHAIDGVGREFDSVRLDRPASLALPAPKAESEQG